MEALRYRELRDRYLLLRNGGLKCNISKYGLMQVSRANHNQKADPRLLSGDPLSTFYASKITLLDQSTLNADTSIFSLSAAA